MVPSFSSRSGYLALQRSAVHPLLALSLPSLFLLSLDAVMRALMPSLTFPPPAFSVFLPLVGVEEVALSNLLFAERAGRGARLRELLAVLVVTWAALVLVRGIAAGSVTVVHLDFVYPLVLVFLMWVFTWAIHLRLREREILLSALTGKKGGDLLHELRDASMQAAVAARGLAAVKLLASLFQAVIFILLLFCAAQRARVGAPGLVLCAANTLLGLLAIGTLSMFGEHQLLLGEGLVVPGRMEGSRFLSMLVVVLASLPAAFLASRGDAPLPLSAILALLGRLLRLLPSIPLTRLADAAGRLVLQQQRYEALLHAVPPVPLNPLFLLLLEFLRRLVPVIILMALYFFLVSPLLNEEFLRGLRSRSLISFLRGKLRRFAHFCRRLWRGARALIRGAWKGRRWVPEPSAADRVSSFESRFPARAASVRKRLQMGRVLKAFNRLLRWSGSRGMPYRRGETPREFSLRLLAVLPQMASDLELIVDVLEESLFSMHMVAAARVAVYLSAIEGIRQSPVARPA